MKSRAFTLVETVVVVALTALITLVLGTLLIYFYRTNAYTLQQSQQVQQARRGVEDAMLHLREASYGSDGSYPISIAGTSTIMFYANINNDTLIEQVTYTLKGKTLYRIVGTPVGNPPTYAGETLATSTLALPVSNATSTPIFRYFDNTGAELTAPVNVSKVASVTTTIIVDVDTNRAPLAFTLSGGATIRNLRSQL